MMLRKRTCASFRQVASILGAVTLLLMLLVPITTAEPIRIQLAAWTWQEPLEKLLNEFSAENPDIKVELMVSPSLAAYRDRIPTSVAGGVGPDVAMVSSSDFVHWVSMYLPLDELVAQDAMKLDRYFPVSINAWRWRPGSYTVGDGPLYAMPLTFQSPSMFMYNIQAFDDVGLAYPNANWTWDTEVDAAKRLTRDTNADGKPEKIGIQGLGSLDDMWARVWQAGGQFISLDYKRCMMDQPVAIKVIEFLRDRVKRGVAGNVTGGFWGGNAGMLTDGQWLIGTNRWHEKAEFPWGVALNPKHPETGSRMIGARPDGIGVMAGTKHKEASWRLVKWLTSEKVLARRAAEEQIAIPHIQAAVKNLYSLEAGKRLKMPPGWENMPQALMDVHPTYHLGYETGKIRGVAGDFLIKARAGEISPETAGLQMAQAVNAILQAFGK